MDLDACIAAIEAQFVMGHRAPAAHTNAEHTQITAWSWDESDVRQALHVPCDDVWETRLLALEQSGLVCVCSVSGAPVDENEPRDNWAELSLYPEGVLTLARLYGRPYVRSHESPAVLAHWQLVQDESAARFQQHLDGGFDAARHAREWPEHVLYWRARRAQLERESMAPQGDDEAPED